MMVWYFFVRDKFDILVEDTNAISTNIPTPLQIMLTYLKNHPQNFDSDIAKSIGKTEKWTSYQNCCDSFKVYDIFFIKIMVNYLFFRDKFDMLFQGTNAIRTKFQAPLQIILTYLKNHPQNFDSDIAKNYWGKREPDLLSKLLHSIWGTRNL